MKLKKIQVNEFGKLNNKELNLQNGFNIIYGKNESGKSTLLRFIFGMLYGISKNKNGKEISDYDRFLPWNGNDFSGKITYELDDNKEFEVYRDFKKKNPVIYNELKEDITSIYKVDRLKGVNFFEEQTGINENIFENTALISQTEVRIDKNEQNNILQKINNLIDSGEDNVSYKKTLDKINKMQLEEVGTEKSQARPLNLINKKIDELKKKKEDLEYFEIEKNVENSEILENKISYQKNKLQFLRELNEISNEYISKNNEINFIEKDIENSKVRLDELNNEVKRKKEGKLQKENLSLYIAFAIISIILIPLFLILNLNKLFLIIPLLLMIISLVMIFIKINKNNKSKELENLTLEKINNEIEIILDTVNKKKKQINEKEEEIDNKLDEVKYNLFNSYKDVLDNEFISSTFDSLGENFNMVIDKESNSLNEMSINLAVAKNQTQNNIDKLNDLIHVKEELDENIELREELLETNKAYNLAKVCLDEAHEEIKKFISPRFISNLNDIISKVSNNKYNNVIFNEDDGIKVEIENGNYVNISRLSTGTIDEIYLGLRLSALNEIAEETIPIFLDETFAYFDDNRLSNILNYLNNNFKENQFIIFTCSKREIEVMNASNISYNYIEL